ncbi:unnamed protein product, partial [Rotaria sp. Silwood2]
SHEEERMVSHEQSTQTDQFPCRLFGFKLRDSLKCISSLLLPLTLGVFTVVITFQQQKAAKQQRDEDRNASQLQREQDRNESALLRELERNLTDDRFSNSSLVDAKFWSTIMHVVKFPFASLKYADFSRTNTSYVEFRQTTCVAARFTNANLSHASFWKSNAKLAWFVEADLTNVNISCANLYKAVFTGTNISDSQLHSALSIQDALLPNGTLAHDKNLIKNGQADCNISVNSSWTLQTVSISPMVWDNDTNDCRFVLQAHTTGAAMFQRIDLSTKWDSNFWSYSQVVLSARMSSNAYIELRGINSNGSVAA